MAPAPLARSMPPVRPEPAFLGSAGMIAAALLAVYWPALRGGMLWDDDAHVTRAALRSWSGLGRIWFQLGATQQYYPVLHSAFWIEHRLWGDAVLGYHLLNVALHGLAAWLLIRVLRLLSFGPAGLVGLAFALHPVAVESVAWISEQKNTLSAVFYFGAALLYLRFDGAEGARRSYRFYWAAAGCFLLALLTKSVTATLPAALLVILWWRRGRLEWRRDVAPLAPWLGLAAASGVLTAWVERTLIGAAGADFALSGPQRVVLAARAVGFYAAKTIWPVHLIFIYPRWNIDAHAPLQALGAGLVLAALGMLALLARRWRGPLAGTLFFVGTLFPALGFVNVYPFVFSFVADHFQYLAGIGLLALIGWGLGELAAKLRRGATVRLALLLLWPATLGLLAARQAACYRDADTLNRATLAANPSAWLAHYNLAVSLGQHPQRREEAIAEYRATVRLKPDHWAAHCNLGSALLKAGQPDAAEAEYETALRLNPRFAEAHNDLAVLLGGRPGRRAEAIGQLREALRLRPDYDGAHGNLGALLLQNTATRPEAVREFQAAIRLAPDNPEYHYNLADAWADDPARREEAVAEYRAALKLRPDYLPAHANLAATLLHLRGRGPEAVEEYRAALRLAPRNAALHLQFAVALIMTRAPRAQAAAELQTALQLQPDLEPARRLLEKLR